MDLDLPKAAVAAVDEAAIKLDPELKVAIAELMTGLEATLTKVLVGRKITIVIE